ncbi:MAG: T9SS type A sorting domain-containing protein [candidate division KSB1 bacterium]|nr:T9SS type A sorting domain-containing protein [candidate division KSB1 bacterium]MDZ7385195.1 T9SS type A sorting domain-containing protein [candidate division KSB1 bacterium]MDZ7391844.1 T9SS type A sorting domain-containing protein [candidate division KSB1 bacterium]MDZ7412298.1 T9SS type A sorting domain-containing protein [candidate division KSB1 bacterium]
MLIKTTIAGVAVVVFASSPVAHTQYAIQQSVFGNGTATAADSAFRLIATVGQATAGVTSSATHTARSGFWHQAAALLTSVKALAHEVPKEFRLEQNYPNPFNPSTTICFALPEAAHVTLKLYDVLGREVVTLVDDRLAAGLHKVLFCPHELPSGVYFCRMTTNQSVFTRKLVLAR